jgi:DNA-binding Lrp family transcriptional regulator
MFMPNSPLLSSLQKKSRQEDSAKGIDKFVWDFFHLWDKIHQEAPNLTLSDIKDYSQSILESITLPFYEKFKHLDALEKYDSYVKELSSILIHWVGRGRIMFPLRLITYEIAYHEENLFEFYIKSLETGAIVGTIENLFNFLFPILINFTIPLSEVELGILKAQQHFQKMDFNIFRATNVGSMSEYTEVSTRTILRHMSNVRYLQMSIPAHFLDMGKLGYETLLISHFNPIPSSLKPYTLISSDFTVSKFSIFQVPLNKSKIILKIREDLEPLVYNQMTNRIQSWNLSILSPGKDGWKVPPPFLHCDPITQIISPSPDMALSLKPTFDHFRKLTRADIKILEFLTTTGSLVKKKNLSQAVNVSVPEITKRLEEYQKHKLLFRVHQFFNLGLDLTPFFFISCPNSLEIPWINHFLAFPKIDLFYSTEESTGTYFGFVKLPPKWIKDFSRKITKLRKDYPELKFHYTIDPPEIPKWSITLSDTYF